jgi:hypothetical protein
MLYRWAKTGICCLEKESQWSGLKTHPHFAYCLSFRHLNRKTLLQENTTNRRKWKELKKLPIVFLPSSREGDTMLKSNPWSADLDFTICSHDNSIRKTL